MSALESQLTLVSFFANMLGYTSNAAMLQSLRGAADGWGGNGLGHKEISNTLKRLDSGDDHITRETWRLLEKLDGEIHEDWGAINRKRKVSLKYFQYLACLSSAYYLHRLADDPESLAKDLRDFSASSENLESMDGHEMNKLAFWMATGSGKTLLMHMHYKQFLRYMGRESKQHNFLLITPNEELSKQHFDEMKLSDIPCFRHGKGGDSGPRGNAVRILEITKFTDKKGEMRRGRNGGKSVDVNEFIEYDVHNVVFVDEGHKGSGGDAWFRCRDKLTKNGFAFEYSATFGQALGAADKDDRTAEYARAIAFDYSYRYFYNDGYGKDFSILNIGDESYPNPDETPKRDMLMLGNLLAFFQQQWAFANNREDLRPYNVEKPLLLLLGATVTGDKQTDAQADMVSIIAFLQRAVADKDERGAKWLERAVSRLLNERSGITTGDGKDAFAGKFDYLNKEFADMKKLCRELRKTLFYADAPGALRFRLLKQTKGDRSEIYLQVGDGGDPFGLIYVGNPGGLRGLVKDQVEGVEVIDDSVRSPLFADAHKPESPINILIGARKFMEGWSSWRVCGMGLMNIGRSEGAQIVQLFGRGVRLLGKDFSLKRSEELWHADKDKAPPYLNLLETLNIFAIRANFMAEFRGYLEREGVATHTFTLPLMMNPIVRHGDTKLQTLKMPQADKFDTPIPLAKKDGMTVNLEMRVKTQAIESGEEFSVNAGDIARGERSFKELYCDDDSEEGHTLMSLLDFDDLYRRLLDYKRSIGRDNLLILRENLEGILDECVIHSSDPLVPESYEGLLRLHQIAFAALRKYADRLYYREQGEWEREGAEYLPLLEQAGRKRKEYFISLRYNPNDKPQKQLKNLERLRELFEEEGKCARYLAGGSPLPRMGGRLKNNTEGRVRIAFDEHIYIPLLLEAQELDISPPGLTEGEKKFAEKLRQYIEKNKGKDSRRLFLLRNESKGRGLGFHESEGFYPDFILWIVDGKKQRIVFVEPHGMLHADAYSVDFKARLWESVRDLSKKLQKKNNAWKNITMDSYVVSGTGHNDLKKKYGEGNWSKDDFTKKNILFADDDNLIEKIINPNPPA